MMEKDLGYWLGVWGGWCVQVLNTVGAGYTFLFAIAAVALGVQLGCVGSKTRKVWMTSLGLVLTGSVASGCATLLGAAVLGQTTNRWLIACALVLGPVAVFSLVAQVTQHVLLIRRMDARGR